MNSSRCILTSCLLFAGLGCYPAGLHKLPQTVEGPRGPSLEAEIAVTKLAISHVNAKNRRLPLKVIFLSVNKDYDLPAVIGSLSDLPNLILPNSGGSSWTQMFADSSEIWKSRGKVIPETVGADWSETIWVLGGNDEYGIQFPDYYLKAVWYKGVWSLWHDRRAIPT